MLKMESGWRKLTSNSVGLDCYCLQTTNDVSSDSWEDLHVPEDGVKVEDIDVYKEHIAVYERTSQGLFVSVSVRVRVHVCARELNVSRTNCAKTKVIFISQRALDMYQV